MNEHKYSLLPHEYVRWNIISSSTFKFSTMFPQHCSRLLWNTEECMNMKEYMLNVEELIYSSTFYFSTMSPNIVLDLGITKYNLQSYIIISAQTDMAKRMFPVEMTNKLQLTLSDPVRQIN